VVDMVGRIADCCDDGALRRLVEGTPAYAELVDEEISYQGKDGRKRWNELGDIIADSWERAISRVESWLSWQGDFTTTEFDDGDSLWERVGAQPIRIELGDATYLTVRGEVPTDAEATEFEVAFIGGEDTVAVFTEVADLARYCRTAQEHRLVKLEFWNLLAEENDDDAFAPDDDAVFDLRKPSSTGAELVRELAEFCGLDADLDVLDNASIDRDDWRDLVTEVATCFQPAD
jgi:hypothetical protein